MNTLALDLGTNTGFAVLKSEEPCFSLSGTWHLASEKELQNARKSGLERRLDIRFQTLLRLVQEIIEEFRIERVIFEDVLFCSTQAQAQLWARLSAAVWAAVLSSNKPIDVQCVPVQTLKIFATQRGNADKNLMIESLFLKYRDLFKMNIRQLPKPPKKGSQFENVLTKLQTNTEMDDNEVDAIWLSEYARAADEGRVTFSSIWEKKKEAKKEKRLKQKQKQAGKQVLSS